MALRAGLIGFGLAGRYFHAPLIEAAGLELSAAVTSRAKDVRENYPRAAVIGSADALIASDDIDIVVIASPNQFHFPQARDAMLAGKHVIVDKPLSITASEAESLADLARSRNVKLAAFQNRRWDSDFLTIQSLLARQQLGEVVFYRARWDRFRPAVADRWRERPEPGGGILYDLGSHLIDQALCLFGKPDWLTADVFMQRKGAAVDDGFEILMGKGALRISLGVSSLASDGDWRYCLHGTSGSFFKRGLDPQEEQLRAGILPSAASFGVEPENRWGTLTKDSRSQTIESARGTWVQFYERMRGAIENNGPEPVTASEAALILTVIEAAQRSSSEGRRIDL